MTDQNENTKKPNLFMRFAIAVADVVDFIGRLFGALIEGLLALFGFSLYIGFIIGAFGLFLAGLLFVLHFLGLPVNNPFDAILIILE